MVKSQSDFLMKNLQAISGLSTEGAPEKANIFAAADAELLECQRTDHEDQDHREDEGNGA